MIKFERITRENIKKIAVEDVRAFSFAEVGAMGSGGCVEIVVKDEKGARGYRTNYSYGVFEPVRDIYRWEQEQEIIFDLFPILRELDFNRRIIRTYANLGDWFLFDMGYGNHLLVKPQYAVEIMERFGGKPVGDVYSGWKDFFEELLL